MNKYIKEFDFYERYHRNSINKILHVIGIPTIVWSVLLYTHRIKIANIKLSNILYFYHLVKYMKINIHLGFLSSFFYYIIYTHSYEFYLKNKSLKYVIYPQIFGWLLQFYGHIFHERNSPAILTSVKQSLTLAPLFVVNEIDLCLSRYI